MVTVRFPSSKTLEDFEFVRSGGQRAVRGSDLHATSFFWQSAGNFLSQLLLTVDLVPWKKLHATTPAPITLLAGISLLQA
jgi:hypothetical protein